MCSAINQNYIVYQFKMKVLFKQFFDELIISSQDYKLTCIMLPIVMRYLLQFECNLVNLTKYY